jgi:hypothetical protein
MTFFNFTTTDHELSLREMGEMQRAVLAQIQPALRESLWSRIVTHVIHLRDATMNSAYAGAFVVLLVVGSVGSYTLFPVRETQSDTLAREVGTATTKALAVLDISAVATMRAAPATQSSADIATTSFAASEARIAATTDTAAQVATGAAVPAEVTEALAIIDAALSGSSRASDVPIARIVASLATLQSVAETHVEEGVSSAADDAVLAFIADKKPLLSLLVATASDADKLAIHTAAAEFILDDVRSTDEARGVFAESFLATRTTDDTADLLDDLSTVKAVASAANIKL